MTQQLGDIESGVSVHFYFETHDLFGNSRSPVIEVAPNGDNFGVNGFIRIYKDDGQTWLDSGAEGNAPPMTYESYPENGIIYDVDCFGWQVFIVSVSILVRVFMKQIVITPLFWWVPNFPVTCIRVSCRLEKYSISRIFNYHASHSFWN